MFSLQLHIPLDSPLGRKIPLIQHLVATAVVMAFKRPSGYEVSGNDMIIKSANETLKKNERSKDEVTFAGRANN